MSKHPRLPAAVHRLVTYALFTTLALTGIMLEKSFHEVYVFRLLLFAAIGVWARELAPAGRRWLLGTVALLWGVVMLSWAVAATRQVNVRALKASRQ